VPEESAPNSSSAQEPSLSHETPTSSEEFSQFPSGEEGGGQAPPDESSIMPQEQEEPIKMINKRRVIRRRLLTIRGLQQLTKKSMRAKNLGTLLSIVTGTATSKTLVSSPSQVDIGRGHRGHIMIGLTRDHDVEERAEEGRVTKDRDVMMMTRAHCDEDE
jgi:hypothetical protein